MPTPVRSTIALLSLATCLALPAAARTVHVSATTCPAAGSGTLQDPYCSIQSAICGWTRA